MHQVLAPLKRKGDKWPNKKKDMIALYPRVKDRAALEFNIDSICVDAANNDDEENINHINDDGDSNNNTGVTDDDV